MKATLKKNTLKLVLTFELPGQSKKRRKKEKKKVVHMFLATEDSVDEWLDGRADNSGGTYLSL